MNKKKILLILVLIAFFSLSFNQASRGQNLDLEKEPEVEMLIKNDGTYEINSNVSIEDIPVEMIMVENLDLQTDIEEIEEDEIRIKTNSKIGFDNILGLYLLNKSLKTAIPGDISDFIPQDMRSLIEGVIDLEKLDQQPVQILTILNYGGQLFSPIDLINSNFLSKIEGKTVKNLLKEYNLEENIPTNLKNYIPNSKIEEIEITDYNWEKPILDLGVNIELSEGTENIQKFLKAIPLKIDLSYLTSYLQSEKRIKDPEAEVNIGIDSGAPLPGYKEGEAWSIKPPSKVNQMLDDIGIWEREGGVNFTLKIPETSEVHNLPENHKKIDDTTYQWTGESGKNAIRSIAENETLELELEEQPKDKSPTKNPLLWGGIVALIAIIAIIGFIINRQSVNL